jgi:hypothetical protein
VRDIRVSMRAYICVRVSEREDRRSVADARAAQNEGMWPAMGPRLLRAADGNVQFGMALKFRNSTLLHGFEAEVKGHHNI